MKENIFIDNLSYTVGDMEKITFNFMMKWIMLDNLLLLFISKMFEDIKLDN